MAVDQTQMAQPATTAQATVAPEGQPAAKASTTSGVTAAQLAPQYAILAAVIVGWFFSLYMYYVQHVSIAQPIADGGWAALLIAFRADFGQSASAQAG